MIRSQYRALEPSEFEEAMDGDEIDFCVGLFLDGSEEGQWLCFWHLCSRIG